MRVGPCEGAVCDGADGEAMDAWPLAGCTGAGAGWCTGRVVGCVGGAGWRIAYGLSGAEGLDP